MADPSPFDDFDDAAGGVDETLEFDADGAHGDAAPAADSAPKAAPAVGAVFDENLDHEHADAPVSLDHKEEDIFGATDGGADHQPELDAFGQAPAVDDLALQGPTPLSLWEAERRIVLDQRIQKAKADKAQALQTAAGEISNFYKQREEKLNKTKTTNREEEKNLKTDLESLMKNGTLWEKVARLSNLQPKAGDERKVARMRKLLLTLKNDRVDEDMKAAKGSAVAASNGVGAKAKKGGKA